MQGTGPGFGSGAPNRGNGVGLLGTSRMKRVLGLKTLRRSTSRRTSSVGGGGSSNPSSPGGHGHGTFGSNPGSSPSMSFTVPPGKLKRPLTSAEIMRQQMRVTEQSDNRLRKTLMRTLVGQVRTYL